MDITLAIGVLIIWIMTLVTIVAVIGLLGWFIFSYYKSIKSNDRALLKKLNIILSATVGSTLLFVLVGVYYEISQDNNRDENLSSIGFTVFAKEGMPIDSSYVRVPIENTVPHVQGKILFDDPSVRGNISYKQASHDAQTTLLIPSKNNCDVDGIGRYLGVMTRYEVQEETLKNCKIVSDTDDWTLLRSLEDNGYAPYVAIYQETVMHFYGNFSSPPSSAHLEQIEPMIINFLNAARPISQEQLLDFCTNNQALSC